MPILSDKYYTALDRAHTYAPPPAGFDPLTASPTELATFGLPARPDAATSPELYEFWRRLLSPPFTFLVPEFPKRPTPPATQPWIIMSDSFRQRGRSRDPGIVSFGHREASSNWSGAYITPHRPFRFNFIAGGWITPTPAAPSVPPNDVGLIEEYRSSTWIGLDGHRSRYPQASLPQIGTGQDIKVINGVATIEYGAWWQWWKKSPDATDPENAPVPITNFRVHRGNEILTCLIVVPPTPGDVRFIIKNQTTGDFCTFIVVAPGAVDPLGSTAEWIMERPNEVGSRRTYPLPHCTDVTFHYCLAQSAADFVSPAVTQSLAGNARFINMYERFANPHRIAFVSKAAKASSTSTRIVYHEAGS